VKKSLYIALLGVFALLTLGSGWMMWSRYQQDELWGHLPLMFYLSLWALILFLLQLRRFKDVVRWRRLGLATLSGVLLAAAFPPIAWGKVFIFAGFVPLLLLERELRNSGHPKPIRSLAAYAYHGLIVWNILVTFWVANTAFVAGVFAISVNTLFMLAPILLYALTLRYMPKVAGGAFMAYWLSFEYIHLRWEISWPWLSLGNAFADVPSMVQWYEWLGVPGGSLWVLLLNWLLYQLWIAWEQGEPAKWKALRATVLLILPILISLVRFNTYETGRSGPDVEVVLIQPNFEPHYEKFRYPVSEQMNRFLELSESALSEQTDYLVFPETSFGLVEQGQLGRETVTAQLAEFVRRFPRLKLVAGLSVYRKLEEDEPDTPNTREVGRRQGEIMRYEVMNAAVQFRADSREIPLYRKSRLVPGAEILPYKKYLFFLEPLVNKLDGSIAGNATQEKRDAFDSPNGVPVAPIICYESVYGEYHGAYIRDGGAQLGFVMTNDGWWDNTAGHKQHMYYASLRAIETRRDIARSANTGISCFIDQRGIIRQQTAYEVAAAVKGSMTPNDAITFYVRWGDMVGRIALFLSILLLLNTGIKGLMPKDRP
jgi:apolipoprotein N-acyltransferase